MRKIHPLSLLSALLVFSALLTGCEQKPAKQSRFRIIHNNDGTDALFNVWFNQKPLTKADIINYVDMVAETQVTTYMMCSGSDFLYFESPYGRAFGSDGEGKYGCEDTTTLRVMRQYYQNIKNLEAEGTDLIEASLLRAQEKGMEAFITYRMNDLHFADTSNHCPIQYSDFWMAHPQYWLGDTTLGWHSAGALNFAIQAVRDQKLGMIIEQLEKYPMIDGFDMDFMRFPVFFKTGEGPQNAHLITQLVKDVRTKVDSLSKLRGKKIMLSVRVPFTLDGCTLKGLDVREWAQQGLIDFISIGAHWKGEPAMPIAKFREDFGYPNIPLYGSIDDGGYTPRQFYSHGMFRGMASNILAQGADGLYLFNYYFGLYNSELGGNIRLEPGDQVCRVIAPNLLHELGSLETLKNRNKVYCASDGVTDTYRILHIGSLPVAVSDSRMASAHIYIGDQVREQAPEESILFLRTDKPAIFRTVLVNGVIVTEQRPEYPTLYDRTRGSLGNDQNYAFIIPAGALKKGDNEIEMLSEMGPIAEIPEIFVVRRLEVALKYGDVSTHGYF